MHYLYPSDPIRPKRVDEIFFEEAAAFRTAGFGVSVASLEDLRAGVFAAFPPLPASTVIYRGWMLSEAEYETLATGILSMGAKPLTDTRTYLSAHHLPNWYSAIADLTPETRVFSVAADLIEELRALNWPQYFIKDYVKSLKTSVGSIISSPEQAATVAAEMRHYRGTIEGGFCVRRVEDFLPETERRYFVLNGKARSADGEIPPIVLECARRMASPFFSVDIAERADGVLRVVEVGDGQVSDLAGWTPEQFVAIFGDR